MTQPDPGGDQSSELRSSDIGSYRRNIDDTSEEPGMEFLAGAPIVRRLSGSLPPEASLDDYARYLETKYGESSEEPSC